MPSSHLHRAIVNASSLSSHPSSSSRLHRTIVDAPSLSSHPLPSSRQFETSVAIKPQAESSFSLKPSLLSHPPPSIYPPSAAIYPSIAIKRSNPLPSSQPSVAGGPSHPKPSSQAIHRRQAESSVAVEFFANNGIGIDAVDLPSSSPTTNHQPPSLPSPLPLPPSSWPSLLLVACHSRCPCHRPCCRCDRGRSLCILMLPPAKQQVLTNLLLIFWSSLCVSTYYE